MLEILLGNLFTSSQYVAQTLSIFYSFFGCQILLNVLTDELLIWAIHTSELEVSLNF